VDIHEIRLRNLRSLIQEHASGNLAQFVEVTLGGLTSYKGLQRVTGPQAGRNLGSMLARKIEAQLQLERGWMDQDRSGTVQTGTVPGGRMERAMRLAQSIEALSPSKRTLVEQLIKEFAEQPAKPGRRKK
jgi:hypothetical protein